MRTINDWAEFYFNKGINVLPDNEHFDWIDLRHKKLSTRCSCPCALKIADIVGRNFRSILRFH